MQKSQWLSAVVICKPVALFLMLSGTFLLSIISFSRAAGQGNLMIMPKRIVFEGGKRSGELNLANIGKDTARYEISLIHYRMKEDGSMELLETSDSSILFVDKFVRFFPRSVVLAPNESQIVRIQTTKTANLSEGEYRSHIYFRAVSEPKPLSEEKLKTDSSSITFNLKPIFGISIPVIIRSGESNTNTSLSKVSFEFENDTTPVLTMDINRTGNMSVYGDISVHYVALQGKNTDVLSVLDFNISGNAKEVALVKGIAVYTPNTVRPYRILLGKESGIDYHSGALHVVFTDHSGRKTIVAQEQILLH